jgi:hypothetical protein
MKTINRIALGTMSSLLLSAGLNRAAEKVDPLTKSLRLSMPGSSDAFSASANSCATPCYIQAE